MLDLGAVKKDFSALLAQVQPWTLSHFVMWLDIKVAEYKVFGRMIMADNTPNDTPQWLRASADYLEQQHKEAQAQVVAQAVAQAEKDMSPPAPPPPPPPLSPRSAHTIASLRPAQPINSVYEPVTSFATTASSLYTVTTVNTTVTSPSVSPGYTGVAQIRPPAPAETYQKQQVPISSPDIYTKPSPLTQFQGYHAGSQRIPPISHLSPKHIRQSHLEQTLSSMAVPVSIASVTYNKDTASPHASKESLTTAEVESQIAVLESQIAAVNRSLKQSAQAAAAAETLPAPVPATPSKSTRRKAETPAEDVNGTFVPPPYPKKTRQQSPVSASRAASVESTLPPLHTSMDMLARMHRIDTDSIPESLRSQNIQSTLEAFEALRTQTFPANTEVLRTQIQNEVESIQNTAQDMSLHHVTTEREQLAAYATTPVERDQTYTVAVDREQTYTPTSVDRESASAAYNLQSAEVQVKVEAAGQSDEDSMGGDGSGLRPMEEGEVPPAVAATATVGEDGQTYPVGMYASTTNTSATADEKLAAEITTKKMRRKFLESMKNSNPKYYSHQIQQIIPFPERFPVANLDYGLKALQMIQTGEITRAGKIQLIDTIFHELIKYTGLYPTPTQKMAVANAIVETFPTLAAKMKASHISPADSWYVILCDKFRNERRGLSGSGSSPRVSKAMKKETEQSAASLHESTSMDTTEEATVEVRTTEEEIVDDASHHTVTPPSSVPTATPTATPTQLHQHQQQQQQVQQQQQQQAAAVAAAAQVQQYSESAVHAAFQQAYPTSQATSKEHAGVPDITSEEEEEEIGEPEKMLNNEERRLYTDKAKRVRRKTHSPKRVQKTDLPILDERYAASLLEYYSKHKPYYPGEGDIGRTMDVDNLKGDATLVIDDKGVNTSASVNQAIAQAVASHAVGNTDEPYSAEVAAIVQSVVSAHMDEVLAARNYQGTVTTGTGEPAYPILQQPQEVEGTVEVKTTKKQKPKIIQQKEKTPEQMQVNLQRFKQKLAVTYPGVQAIDDATLLCTCGTKVKLGRARMLHNYTNYHLKRCQNPPANVRHESHSPSSATPGSVHSMYAGSPGELNIPTSGPRVITKEVESAAYSGLSAADKESIQKHFLLNVPVPTSETMSTGSSTPPNQSLDLSMPVAEHVSDSPTPTMTMSASEPNNLTVTSAGHMSSDSLHVGEGGVEGIVVTATDSQTVLNMSMAGQTALLSNAVLVSEAETRCSSVIVTTESEVAASQSLDLSVQTSGPSVLIEHQPGSDLRMQIPGSIATSITEYSGELPDLSAINALALIQGKADHAMETIETEPPNSEEPINLADS